MQGAVWGESGGGRLREGQWGNNSEAGSRVCRDKGRIRRSHREFYFKGARQQRDSRRHRVWGEQQGAVLEAGCWE